MDERPESGRPKSKFDSPVAYMAVVLLLVIAGGGVCAYLIRTKPGPTGEPEEYLGRLVRVFKAEKTSHRVAVTAYGTTRASKEWAAIAEVKGRATQLHSRFKEGEILPAGMLLVRIAPTDYQLAVTRLEAEAQARDIELDELNQTEVNLGKILHLQTRQLALAKEEHDRQLELFARKATSRSALEQAENAYVTSLTAVQNTRNSLALLPVQRALAWASLDAAITRLDQAWLDLSRCEIRLPFAARCASKSIEEDQYVAAGERLGTFLALEKAEVVAMVETRKMPALIPEEIKQLGTLDLTQVSLDESFWKQVKIPVKVSWALGEQRPVWPGRVARIASSLDPATRTVPVIIEVPDPYTKVEPGIRPPLLPEVFCEITAYGATLDEVVVIPRDALRDNRVYLLREGRLHIAAVNVLALEDDLAVIKEGQEWVKAGDLVILTDLFPATEGVPLRAELVDNPVKPRTGTEIHFPDDLFEDADQPATEPPANRPPILEPVPDVPADRSPTTEPAAEATP